jgi:hypothetical protein
VVQWGNFFSNLQLFYKVGIKEKRLAGFFGFKSTHTYKNMEKKPFDLAMAEKE